MDGREVVPSEKKSISGSSKSWAVSRNCSAVVRRRDRVQLDEDTLGSTKGDVGEMSRRGTGTIARRRGGIRSSESSGGWERSWKLEGG